MATKYDYRVLIDGVDATAVFNKMGGSASAQRFLADELVLTEAPPKPEPPPQPQLLQFVSEVVVHATTRFIAKKKFVVNTSADAEVKISWVSDGFKKWFLNGGAAVEEARETTLAVHRLTTSSTDGPIIAELGEASLPPNTKVWKINF